MTLVTSGAWLLGAIGLALVVFQMRRRRSHELAHAIEARNTSLEQNAQLEDKGRALEQHAAELERAARAFEMKVAELETQTAGLQATVEELREAERRQRGLADDSARLTRRLADVQRIARLGYWEYSMGKTFWSEEMYALAGIHSSIQPPPTDMFIACMHPDDRQRMQNVARHAAATLTEFTEVFRLPDADGAPGSWRTVQMRGRVMGNDSGERKLAGTVQDITERVLLEARLRRAQKMEAVGRLAGGIAHDFNNILTVIDGFSSLLLAAQPADSAQRDDIEEIRGAAGRAATLTRQLLALSRQQVLQPRVLDLNDAIVRAETMVRRLIGDDVSLETQLQPGVELIKADPDQLEHVIVNLILNAREAMPTGGTLTIETANATASQAHPTAAPGRYVMLSITDTGTGIAPENVDRIYEPFFTTKASGLGAGLGLSTVLGIVEQSGGHIRLLTKVGSGTSFKLYFPWCDARSPTPISIERIRPATTGSETILLVEDDGAVRAVARAALRRAGYTVITAHDGLDALRRCENENMHIDLVVTDMVMPGMGGRDLAIRLRQQHPAVPILLMSGYTRDSMIHNAGLAEGESFIEKPFTPALLTQRVRDAIDAAALRRPDVNDGA